MKKEKILIVSYTFPPDKEIGGKRWSKFAKYLIRSNYEVHVITHKKVKKNRQSENSSEINNLNIHEISAFYPEILSKKPTKIWEKIMYNFWIRVLPFFHRGSIYDKSIFLEQAFSQKFKELITQHKIQLVFVTCAPFHLANYSAKLKQKLDFFLTIDFRDPWTWGQGYGYSNISNKRIQFEKRIEKKVIEEADLILSPSIDILNHLSKDNYSVNPEKFYLVPHAIDTDNINQKKEFLKNSKNNGRYKCIYAGTLYDGYAYFLDKLIAILKHAENNFQEFYSNFQLDIYSSTYYTNYEFSVKAQGLENKIRFYNPISETELFDRIIDYDYSLIYFPERFKNFISTKFYELIYVRIPILYVGNSGLVSDLLTNSELGYYFDIESFESSFVSRLRNVDQYPLTPNFDIEKFTYTIVTNQMMDRVKHLLTMKKSIGIIEKTIQ